LYLVFLYDLSFPNLKLFFSVQLLPKLNFLSPQNSSEELLQLVERHCDHFRVAPQYPLYMNFISSFANNSYTREQLRKQKVACVSSKGSYIQVYFHSRYCKVDVPYLVFTVCYCIQVGLTRLKFLCVRKCM
jgi:hypothetical protein